MTNPPEHDPSPHRWRDGLAVLSPAYFGMVMATGIVSIAAHMFGLESVAQSLFALNLAFYAILWVLTVLRALRFPAQFFGDMIDHLRGPGFFTTSAGTSILGTQFVLLTASYRVGAALWVLAVALWVVLTYAIFAGFTVRRDEPTLDKGISGSWLLAIVATQGVAVLTTLLAARAGQPFRMELNFAALSLWLWGGMLYIFLMTLIFYRYTFFPLSPADLSPPYWINMGAMAISTLAGSLLIQNAADAPFLLSLLPFIKGFTLLYWATGTWWIPMLLVLGVWRYVYRRFRMEYDPLYWGVVFPLGMYAAATHEMIEAMGFAFLAPVAAVFLGIGLLAWTCVLAACAVNLVRRRQNPSQAP